MKRKLKKDLILPFLIAGIALLAIVAYLYYCPPCEHYPAWALFVGLALIFVSIILRITTEVKGGKA